MAFTNVDYNKVQYADGNPYEEAFDASLNRSKNFAAEALDKKKSQFMFKLGNYLEDTMMPPDGASATVTGPDGTDILDPGFYQILEYTDRAVWQQVQQLAHAEGLGPHTLDKIEIRNYIKDLRKEAVTKQFKMIRDYGNRVGDSKMALVLNKEGAKFANMYNEYYDPYVEGKLGSYEPAKRRVDTSGWWNRMWGGTNNQSGNMISTAMANKKGTQPSQTTQQIIENSIKSGRSSVHDTADLIALLEE